MDYASIITAVLTALITGGLALVGTFVSNRKSAALIEYRMQQLENKVSEHNNLIDRTYRLEEKTELQEEKIKVANNRIKDLESKVG